jgi:hypothetical protein
MKRIYIDLIIVFVLGIFITLSCQKKNNTNPTPSATSNTTNNSSTTGGTTAGGSTTGGTTTGGSTTGGTTTGGTTTGGTTTGGNNQKGTIIFHKPENCYNSITLYFQGTYKGVLGPSSRYSNPSCNANGCITITNLNYGNYSYTGYVYAANGTTILYTEHGTVVLNASCIAKSVNP